MHPRDPNADCKKMDGWKYLSQSLPLSVTTVPIMGLQKGVQFVQLFLIELFVTSDNVNILIRKQNILLPHECPDDVLNEASVLYKAMFTVY